MPLQVRVVHALGDQVIDLPDKPAADPVVVGRLEGVDVQVPSTNVSRRHCVLYLQDGGQWVLNDAKSSAGTFVNGHRVTGPSAIGAGDVITLGNDAAAPKVTIDPYGLLQATGANRPAAVPAAISAAPRQTAQPPRPVRQPPAPVAAAMASVPAAAAPRPAAPPPPPPPVPQQEEDWLTQAASAHRVRASRPIRQQSGWTPGVVVGTVVGVVAIVGGAGWYYVKHQDKLAPPPPEKPKVVAANASAHQFDEPAKMPLTVPLAKKGPSPEEERDKRMAERGGDPQWVAVEDAHAGRVDPVTAVDTYLIYLHDHPKTPYAADLRKFIDEDLDRIWWKHIEELLTDRKRKMNDASAKTAEIAQTTDPDFKKQVEGEREEILKEVEVIDAKLKALNYESKEVPNLDDPATMQALRNARDEATWRSWKERAEALIRLSHGHDPLW